MHYGRRIWNREEEKQAGSRERKSSWQIHKAQNWRMWKHAWLVAVIRCTIQGDHSRRERNNNRTCEANEGDQSLQALFDGWVSRIKVQQLEVFSVLKLTQIKLVFYLLSTDALKNSIFRLYFRLKCSRLFWSDFTSWSVCNTDSWD